MEKWDSYTLYVILFILVSINALIGIFIATSEKFDKGRSIRLLFAGNFSTFFLIGLLNLTISISTQKQHNVTQDTVNATFHLSQEIDRLQGVDDSIVSNVEKLSKKTNSTVGHIDSTTTKEANENALSGELDFGYSKPFKDNDFISIAFGEAHMANTFAQIKNWHPKFISIKDATDKGILPTKPVYEPIKFSVKNNKLVVSLTAYDLEGHWIVEIKDNNWHRNPNYTGKFNYDKRWFEIVDNNDNIALNLDLQSNNRIKMQGYIVAKNQGLVLVAGSAYFTSAPLQDGQQRNTALIENAKIIQLFDYTGKGWFGRRKVKN